MYNNYNCNSNGPSIECNVAYDYDLVRLYFPQNITVLESGRYGASLAFCHGQGKDYFDITWTIKGTAKEMRRYLKDFENIKDLNKLKKEELINEAQNSLSDIINNPKDVLHWYESGKISLSNIFTHLGDYDLQIVPNYALQLHITRGYSQGDYCRVYYSIELLESAWGKKPNESQLHEEIDHLFWDSPIYASAIINDQEYNYYDIPGAEIYEFKRAEWIAYLAKESGVSESEISAIMPKTPAY